MKDIKNLLINEKNIKLLEKKENTSFNVKKLLGVDVDQSQSIRFGNLFQDFIKSLVTSVGGVVIDVQFLDVYETGNTKNNKGLKDMDIWFNFKNKMYYFEAKTNLDLDSEKSKATDTKISDITKSLMDNNQEVEVVAGVLSCWYEKEAGLSVKVKTNVCYIKDIFNILGIECSKEDYYNLMKEFGAKIQ